MRLRKIFSCVLVVSGISGVAVAKEQDGSIKGVAELGYVSTSGNSESSNVNAKLALSKETKNWLHGLTLAAIGASAESEDASGNKIDLRSAEKYNADYKADRKLDEKSSLYGLATYEKDRFSGFDEQMTFGAGYGYKVIANDERVLAVEIGPGYRINNPTVGGTQSEVILHLGETYLWNFSETAKFEQFLYIDTGEDNTISRLGLSVTANLTGALALKVATEYKNTDKPGDGFEHTDSVMTANLTYSF